MADVTHRVDDLDKTTTEGVQRITFAFQGKPYQIDLAEKNLAKLTKALEPFIEVASPPTAPVRVPKPPKGTSTTTRTSSTPDYDKEAFKAWATVKGEWTGKRPANALILQFLAEQEALQD